MGEMMSNRDKMPGVYIHTHKKTQHFFIGMSVDVFRSAVEDLRRLRVGIHTSEKFRSLYKECGLIDTQIITCKDREEAEELKWKLTKENYSNPLLLNQTIGLNVSAVYRIIHKPTGHFYIGSTRDFSQRKREHEHRLIKNKNPCKKLQELYNANPDLNDLHWDIILAHPISHAQFLEEKMIKEAWDNPLLLNKAQSAKGTRGVVYTDEERQRRSDLAKQMWTENRLRKDTSISGASKKVSISGTVYESVADASRKTGIAMHLIYHRVRSDKHSDYFYL